MRNNGPPSSDAELIRSLVARIKKLENRQSIRIGEWTIATDVEGNLRAFKPASEPKVLDSINEDVSTALDSGRGVMFDIPGAINNAVESGAVFGPGSEIPTTNLTGQLPVEQVEPAPAAGGMDLGESWQAMWAQFTSAFALQETAGSTLPATSEAAQTVAQQALQAFLLAAEATSTLGVRTNRPTYVGMDNTSESGAVTVADINTTGPLGNINPASAHIAFIRCTRNAQFGSMSFFCNKSTGLTALYMVIYKLNATADTLVHHHTSADIKSLVSLTTNDWVQYNFASDQLAVEAGDVVAVMWHSVGSNNSFMLHGKNSGISPHPTALLRSFAGFLTSPGTTPITSDLDYPTDFTWSPVWPYVALEVTDLPNVFHPPHTTTYTTVGSHTHTLPDWLKVGDFIDIISLGAGGGAQGFMGFTNGEGGGAGLWNSVTLEVGADIHEDATSLTIDVGEPGTGGAPFNGGGNGEASIVGWVDPASAPQTLIADGGGGGPFGLDWNVSFGQPAGNHYHNETTYYGGGIQASGNGLAGHTPGGGGSGGAFFATTGGVGARGQVWIVERQT